MSSTVKERAEVVMIEAEGRGINLSLFERDAFQSPNGGAPGKPMYKAEVAYDPKEIEPFEDRLATEMDKVFGKVNVGTASAPVMMMAGDALLEGRPGFISPLLNGDDLHAARLAKGKEGDAYKGKLVLRAHTAFNRDGVDGPGGAKVYGPDAVQLDATASSTVYNGCFGKLAVTLKTYTDYPRRGDKGVTAYLHAFQKVRDGDPLKAVSASPFAPVAPVAGAGDGVRRRRAG